MYATTLACLVGTLATVTGATGVAPPASNCKEVSFRLGGSATGKNLTGISLDIDLKVLGLSIDLSVLGSVSIVDLWNKAEDIDIAGSQTIAGTFCVPTTSNANNKKIQVLFHSITGARGSWQALGGLGTDFPAYKPELYSWVKYANDQGYPVLNIDRLGNGKSSHPDPILVAQAPYEMALYADLAKQIRAGDPQLPQAYSHLIYVGNSYGSQLGAGIAGAYPDAYTEFILTGFTNTPLKGLVGVALALAAPAQLVDPARFGTLPLGYLTTASKVGRTNTFFGSKAQVDFEDVVGQLFFDRKDVVSLGQFLSVYALPFFGGKFKGRVFNLIGENDQPFCGLGTPLLGPAFCGDQPKTTGVQFPDADYNYKSVNRIGHGVQLHTRSQLFFSIAHRFLAGESFKGGPPA